MNIIISEVPVDWLELLRLSTCASCRRSSNDICKEGLTHRGNAQGQKIKRLEAPCAFKYNVKKIFSIHILDKRARVII